MDIEKLQTLYALAVEFLKSSPDENECNDAENEVFAEVANFVQAVKNSNLITEV